ncbi:Ras GTPase-activating protein rng2 [Phytophthora cinnamomi]|uniref:Ras GTPase-activating protein rng2 n=1 Tax=Phytophthora cinnamomi TaxID=4785 RepID=UPI00355A2AB5|nr:Ras GTPase-activating protein rng2 [Phytophthora cinnamomi]
MDVNMSVEIPNHEGKSDVRESAMGGKLQRNLSLSAKWASDKAMAIEYLHRQREVMTWIESVLKRELPTTDLFEALKSGVVLREMMETLFPDVSNCKSPISRNYSKRMAPWKERENISVFLKQCKSIGMYDLSLFCTDDLYEGTNMVQVLFCVQHFMMFSEEHAGHLFKPVPKAEPAEFSNQELEMAMAKIEQAGVDATALKGLISGASTMPERVAILEKESIVRTASETAVTSTEKALGRVQDEDPAESDPKEKVESEDSGSDAGDEEEVTELEDISMPAQDNFDVETPSSKHSTADDEEAMAIIQQVVSELTAVIEENEQIEAQMKATQETSVSQGEPEVSTVVDISVPDEGEEIFTAPAEDLVVEVQAEPVEQTDIEIDGIETAELPAVDLADTPAESTPVENVAIAQPSVEAIGTEADNPTEDEELEAKAMAKCTCVIGWCILT